MKPAVLGRTSTNHDGDQGDRGVVRCKVDMGGGTVPRESGCSDHGSLRDGFVLG